MIKMMKMVKQMKIMKIFSAVLTALFVLVGFSVQAEKSGGTMVFLVQPEPPTMAGYVSTSGPIGLLAPKIYEGLFDYDNDGKMIPVLAESYDMSSDGKTVTFKLRKGVKWHDGEPFTSEDVQFTIIRRDVTQSKFGVHVDRIADHFEYQSDQTNSVMQIRPLNFILFLFFFSLLSRSA